jgi:hypothetical protein
LVSILATLRNEMHLHRFRHGAPEDRTGHFGRLERLHPTEMTQRRPPACSAAQAYDDALRNQGCACGGIEIEKASTSVIGREGGTIAVLMPQA